MAIFHIHRLRVQGTPPPKDVRIRVHRVLVRKIIPSAHFRYDGAEWIEQRLDTL